MSKKYAWGVGLRTVVDSKISDVSASQTGNTCEVLDAWYPDPQLGKLCADSATEREEELASAAHSDKLRLVKQEVFRCEVNLEEAPNSVEDAYLRLHLLSYCLVEPNSINLDGIFGHLPNVAWTNYGPCPIKDINRLRTAVRAAGQMPVLIRSVDKFPAMLDYVVPKGVRIGDGARVRLGAYLSEGTTVMHEGFVNFNAGTLGASMVEGRISQGVVIGDGSDIGGGASTMGTLSGGGSQRVRLGKRCLLGANSGLGIPLGDDCVVEAGLYITAGTKVALRLEGDTGADSKVKIVSARELAGVSNALFRRNSVTGQVEVIAHQGQGIVLNEDLHKN